MPETIPNRLWLFDGGPEGAFRVTRNESIRGEGLPDVTHLDVWQGSPSDGGLPVFRLRGVTSNERYVTRREKSDLVAHQEPLGRTAARRGALIPIKKSAAWWALTQEERREIFEQRSHHIAIGLEALPAVARRLHHCRDLGTEEPFDFLTWFDYRAEDEPRFDALLEALRRTEEWEYVEREVEIRVER